MKTVAIVSGGMDSVTMAHLLAARGDRLTVVAVDYGQRHIRELRYAESCARRLSVPFIRLDLKSLTQHLEGSALTDRSVDVPHGHYAAESMRSTVVPNRNAILLSCATAIAVANKADAVATAVHAGDHAIYPDCRPEFISAFEHMAKIANEGFAVDNFGIQAPFLHSTKAEIVGVGETVGVPWEKTWSCYEGEWPHCGRCGTCVERREAFMHAGVLDPTDYAPPP
jgi:7-cyano-7-deazaguanine synthase